MRPLARDRVGLSCGITGNGFALTRQTLQAVPYEPDSIVEDLQYHLSIVRAGRRMVFANRTTVRAEMPIQGTAATTQRTRWEGGRIRIIAQNVVSLAFESLRNPKLVEPLLELLLLPLAIHLLLLAAIFGIPFEPYHIYSIIALLVVTSHTVAALRLSGSARQDLIALLALPAYVVWKFRILPATLRSVRSSTEWKRTERQ
jgi:cellulose synthase/poly-beta-1,6-N-acetylglucosamine synthase-like glycosyltransferase